MESRTPGTSSADDNLLYRRQFILSTEGGHALPNSQQVLVAGQYHVSAHRDLELTHVECAGKSLTLLGFALDPDTPEANNKMILQRLIGLIERCEDIFPPINSLGGRWALIVHDGIETAVLHDASGQRQVYFTHEASSGSVVCASEIGIIAERLEFNMDPIAVDFIKSRKSDDYEIYWMPGDTSLFAEIKALLPNHYLSLSKGTCHRFWPFQPLTPLDYSQALAECVRLLRGQVASAHRRYLLSVPMTAGWDSRLMLALNRDYADDLYAFTLAYPHLPINSRDVVIPSQLLAKLGFAHHVIEYPRTIDPAFKAIYSRNNLSANSAYCADTQALHASYPAERVCITGDVAETVKCYYERTRTQAEPVSAGELAELAGLGMHPFAVSAFGKWLETVGSPPIEILDLFCWEQMAGRWQSKIRAEYDISQESFAPLNNRRLLSIMLAVDANSRRAPEFAFFKDLIHELWPEVLCEPINPPERLSRSRRILNVIKKSGVLQLVPTSTKEKIKAILH